MCRPDPVAFTGTVLNHQILFCLDNVVLLFIDVPQSPVSLGK